jgi:tetratricopeptide (TPR) repeat protein
MEGMDTTSDSRFRRASARIRLIGAVLFCVLSLGGCKRSEAFQRFMRPKSLAPVDKSSLTVDELKAAIAEYSTEAERRKFAKAEELGLTASSNLGAYRIELADRYLEKKMFKDAYDVLVLASQSYPGDARIYYSAGMSAANIAKAAEIKGPSGAADRDRWLAIAESCYQRTLSINPRSTQALYGIAVLYAFELGRPTDAAAQLTNLLGIETRNVDAMLLLARCYAELGKIEEAADWYETAAKTTVVPEKRKIAEENRAKLLSGSAGQGGANGK